MNLKIFSKTFFSTLSAILLITTTAVLAEESTWKPGDRHALTEDLSFAGTVRERFEVKDHFKFDSAAPGDTENYLLSQIRLNAKWTAAENVSAFIEGQSADIQGEDLIDDEVRPNIFAEDFDLHQGYVDVSFDAAELGMLLRTGRQKFNFGDQRLVGAFEWSNTARVFDAVSLLMGDATKRSTQLFSSKAVPVDPNDWNDWGNSGNRYVDSTFHGLYYSDKSMIDAGAWDLYYLYRDESEFDDTVSTVGTRLNAPIDAITLDGEAAYQFGDFGGQDHSAYAVHAEASYLFCSDTKSSAALGYNFGSGDDDPTDSDHETFDNLFPTNHAFYGYMDFFSWQNMHNLEVRVQGTPWDKLQLRLAYHNFWLAEEDTDAWYNAGLGVVRKADAIDADSFVGSEIDFTAKYPLLNTRLWLELGYGHFFTGDFVEDTGNDDDADWVYLQGKFEI